MTKEKRIYTEQQELFLNALIPCKGNIRQAMTVAGYSEQTAVKYILNLLHEEIVDLSNKLLAGSAVEAAVALTSVITEEYGPGQANKINAAKEVLDRGGVIKKTADDARSVNQGGGLLILPAKSKTTFNITVSSEGVDEQGEDNGE